MSIELTHGVRPSLTAQVAEEIRVVMTRKRVRQSELARAIGKSEQWVSVRLRGVQPIDLNDLDMIAGVLNVEVADLLPRPMEGRVLTTVGTSDGPNVRLARMTGRPSRRTGRAILARHSRHHKPDGLPQTVATRPTPAVPPSQRRPALVGAAG